MKDIRLQAVQKSIVKVLGQNARSNKVRTLNLNTYQDNLENLINPIAPIRNSFKMLKSILPNSLLNIASKKTSLRKLKEYSLLQI